MARNLRQNIHRGADWQRHINQVGTFDGGLQFTGKNLVRCAQIFCARHGVPAIPRSNVDPFRIFTKRQRERTADQTGAKYADAIDEVCWRHESGCELDHGQAMRRPIAGAMMRNSPINCSNCPGSSDCAPSDRAGAGSLCTPISNPAAPAATAARAMGATLSRRPVPWEGSPIMGRCDSFLITGMAAMSKVLRV